MNKEKLIGKLNMIYTGDKNALNEMIGYYDGLKEVVKLVQEENKQLRENRDKAIEYIEYTGMEDDFDKVLLEILKGENND